MYRVSDAYRVAMKRPVQRHKLTGMVGEVSFTEKDILSGSFMINGQCSESGNVQIGQVYIGELKATFLCKDRLERYSLKGREVTPHFGLRVSGGHEEYLPLGVFTIAEANWTRSGVEVTAYDHMAKLDRSFGTTLLRGTPFQLLKLACTSCGVECGMQEEDFRSFTNGTTPLVLYEDNDIDTWRDVLSWVAQACAANVLADRDGRIIFRSYGRNVVDTVSSEERLNGASFGDYETRYTGLSCVNIEDQTTTYYGEDTDDALTYNLGMNPFLQENENVNIETMRRNILTALGQILYVPFRAEVIGNPAYDLMDVLTFTDGLADGTKWSCMTKYSFRFGERFSFEGDGQNPALASEKSKSDKKIAGLMAQMDSITSSINKLIYDYNTGPLRIVSGETSVGMISFYVREQADVEGHFLMDYVATEPTRIWIRFYDTDVEELYSPVVMDLHEGEGCIGIPHAYLHREEGIHAVHVTVQISNGRIDIPTRGIFFSIDAGNFAEDVEGIPMDIRDLSMRQLVESSGPDEIWTIGIEKGEAFVSKRPYTTSARTRLDWQGVYALGKAIDAAIEFDGEWVYRIEEQQYTLETEDQPWYFWVTDQGLLFAQKGEDVMTRDLLDSGVTRVSACKGYSSSLMPEQDQGLVVAYVREGRPYYRQYAYSLPAGRKVWMDPELLMDEPVEDVRVTRLNDYRLSFTLTNDPELEEPKNYWLITERTYVGNTVPVEQLDLPGIGRGSLFSYMEGEYDETLRMVELLVSDDKLKLTITVDKYLLMDERDLKLKDLITFSSGITPAMVESISMEVDEEREQTSFVVELKQPSTTLVTELYVNQSESPYLHMLLGGKYEVNCDQSVSASYDNTVYRTHSARPEVIPLPGILQGNMSYIDIEERVNRQSDRIPVPTIEAPGFAYIGITMQSSMPKDTVPIPAIEDAGYEYVQTGSAPI